MKVQMELMREGMTVEMGSTDPDGKNQVYHARLLRTLHGT